MPSTKQPASRIFGTWQPPAGEKPANHIDEKAILEVEKESWDCGGTAHLLPLERKKASFDTFKLTLFLDDENSAFTAKRRWLWRGGEINDHSKNGDMTRTEKLSWHVQSFLAIHKKFADEGYKPEAGEVAMMVNAGVARGGFGLHFGAFASTLMSQATPQQALEWLIVSYKMGITGALAQTELGHGSNVRGLQTTAEYDPSTEEFVINTPTLRAMKWWPGNLGKTANFALVYANLIVDKQEKGFHVFMVQLRDEKHVPLPGVTLHEVGPKMGDNFTDTGALRLNNVRIPRLWMMMKHQQVTKDGKYVKNEKTKNAKVQYTTMLSIRSGLVASAGFRLAAAATIATRYSCVRQQGFVDTSSTRRDAPENAIIEYQVQQYRVFKQLAKAYAFIMTGKQISRRVQEVMKSITENEDASQLPAMHAVSAGLKALTTLEVADGMEDLRKCCGGNGVLLASGLAEMTRDYTTYVTAEGDVVILHLQAARFLIKCYNDARKGNNAAVPSVCSYLLGTTPQTPPSGDFTSLSYLLDLFRYRARWAVEEAGERLAALLKQGKRQDEAWNASAAVLVRSSRVHCYVLILQYFCEALERVQDAAVRAILTALAQLYALQNIEDDSGFDLSRAQRVKVHDAVVALLPVIRRDCVALVDAFEYTDNTLNSALGRHDGRVYESLYASALQSELNQQDPFVGYEAYLKPALDLEFIKKHAKQQRTGPMPASKL